MKGAAINTQSPLLYTEQKGAEMKNIKRNLGKKFVRETSDGFFKPKWNQTKKIPHH